MLRKNDKHILYRSIYIYIYQYIQTCSFKDQAGKTLAAHCLGISGYHGDPDIYLRPRKAYIYIYICIYAYIYIYEPLAFLSGVWYTTNKSRYGWFQLDQQHHAGALSMDQGLT